MLGFVGVRTSAWKKKGRQERAKFGSSTCCDMLAPTARRGEGDVQQAHDSSRGPRRLEVALGKKEDYYSRWKGKRGGEAREKVEGRKVGRSRPCHEDVKRRGVYAALVEEETPSGIVRGKLSCVLMHKRRRGRRGKWRKSRGGARPVDTIGGGKREENA